VTRGVPCHRRLDDNFAGDAGMEETIVQDGLVSGGGATSGEDGWLRTGGAVEKEQTRLLGDVRTLDGSGNVNTDMEEYEEEIPDMEDEEDDSEAIIRDPREAGAKACVGRSPRSCPRTFKGHQHANQFLFTGHCAHTTSTSPTRPTIARRASTCPATSPPLSRSRPPQ